MMTSCDPSSATRCATLDEVKAYVDGIQTKRHDLDHEIDGVVVKVDALGDHEALGARSRSPRWAIAYKFAPREEVTTVERIVVQVGRTGKLTPVAVMEPALRLARGVIGSPRIAASWRSGRP